MRISGNVGLLVIGEGKGLTTDFEKAGSIVARITPEEAREALEGYDE